MGFSFEITGPRDEVARTLENLRFDEDLHNDEMGDEISNLISAYISQGMEPGPGLRYAVKASGHSGGDKGQRPIRLTVSVSVEPVSAAQYTEEGKAEETLAIG